MNNFEKLVLRLRKEKKEAEKIKVLKENPAELFERRAFSCGALDVYKMGFSEISKFQNRASEYGYHRLLEMYASRDTKEKRDRLFHEISSTGKSYIETFTETGAKRRFCEAWIKGVLYIWNQVKDKLD